MTPTQEILSQLDAMENALSERAGPLAGFYSSLQLVNKQGRAEVRKVLLREFYDERSELATSIEIVEANTSNRETCILADTGKEDFSAPNSIAATQAWWDNYEKYVTDRVQRKDEPPISPVKVAILDTGISFSKAAYAAFGRQVTDFRCWFQDPKAKHEWCDLDGHGTHCASILLRAGSNVELYVARVFEERSKIEDDKTEEETLKLHQRIADAINYAVDDWGVAILSLSFGFKKRVEVIRKAILHAYSKDVLIFAAASNKGANGGVYFPAYLDEVICVNAFDGKGGRAWFTPDPMPRAYNFAVLGVAVEAWWKANDGSARRHRSGTSCAVPILVGIVATILGYTAASEESHRKPGKAGSRSDPKLCERLRERRVMCRLLARRMTSNEHGNSGYHWLRPWDIFNDCWDTQTDEDPEQKFLRLVEDAVHRN